MTLLLQMVGTWETSALIQLIGLRFYILPDISETFFPARLLT